MFDPGALLSRLRDPSGAQTPQISPVVAPSPSMTPGQMAHPMPLPAKRSSQNTPPSERAVFHLDPRPPQKDAEDDARVRTLVAQRNELLQNLDELQAAKRTAEEALEEARGTVRSVTQERDMLVERLAKDTAEMEVPGAAGRSAGRAGRDGASLEQRTRQWAAEQTRRRELETEMYGILSEDIAPEARPARPPPLTMRPDSCLATRGPMGHPRKPGPWRGRWGVPYPSATMLFYRQRLDQAAREVPAQQPAEAAPPSLITADTPLPPPPLTARSRQTRTSSPPGSARTSKGRPATSRGPAGPEKDLDRPWQAAGRPVFSSAVSAHSARYAPPKERGRLRVPLVGSPEGEMARPVLRIDLAHDLPAICQAPPAPLDRSPPPTTGRPQAVVSLSRLPCAPDHRPQQQHRT
ncbi:hypothetical protein PAPYR_3018 [Paratrimastix pyriformis]|uniref:Uncharacterized protein n=1 Tax=Paratrimastix pyriformis TaxID=342808 RepID=A0ABQ8UR33_9EUKA|nr:hypothetical protein PAPYR_3018 [Paratrimastix pyriformis]